MSAAAVVADPGQTTETAPVAETKAPADAWQTTLASFDPELRADPSLQSVKSLSDLAKGFVDAQRLIGKQSIGLPGEKATPKDWEAFYTKIGRPEKPEGYQKALEGWKPPEGIPWQAELVPKMLEKFHARGLMPQQVRGAIEDYAALQAEWTQQQNEAAALRATEQEEALSKRYGEKYAAATEQARTAFKEVFGENFDQIGELRLADGTKIGDHPAFFDAFVKIGQNIQSHDIVGDKSRETGMSPAQAQAEIDATNEAARKDPSHPYMSKTAAGHDREVARMARLYEIVGSAAARGEE